MSSLFAWLDDFVCVFAPSYVGMYQVCLNSFFFAIIFVSLVPRSSATASLVTKYVGRRIRTDTGCTADVVGKKEWFNVKTTSTQ